MCEVKAIDAQTLKDRLSGDDEWLLLQITSAEVFSQAHIEGAILVTPQELVSGVPPATGRLPELAQLTDLFRRIGYHPDRRCVVYDDEGGGWAGRMGWTLDVIGHRQWDYLDGGMQSWAQAGLPFASGEGTAPAHNAELTLSLDRTSIAEVDDVLAAIEDPGQVIWDVRSEAEYLGQRQASARVGHIPGALNYDWLLLKDATQCLNPAADAALQKLGIGKDKAIITHCQTHHRSGLSYMWGRLQGWNIRAYHGSWSEWGNREDTPIDNPSAP
jgi:thiosulfate/3-mercaptopyruvate sulfurtransferase